MPPIKPKATDVPPPADEPPAMEPQPAPPPVEEEDSSPKRIPIRFAEEPGNTPPPIPSKENKRPKAPPGVKIVSEEETKELPPPVPEPTSGLLGSMPLPPVISSVSDNMHDDEEDDDIDFAPLPPMNPTSGLLDDEFSDISPKKKGLNKDIIIIAVILVVLVAGVGFLAYGVLNIFKDDTAETEEVEPYEVTESEATAHLNTSDENATSDTKQAASEKEPDITVTEDSKVVADVDPDLPVIDYGHPNQPTLAELPQGERRPNPQIQDWVENLSSFAVSDTLIIIKNQPYKQGDVVNEELGLRWMGHNPKLKLLHFVDEYNVVYEKDY